MTDDLLENAKKKKWSDLSTTKKAVFISSLALMIGVLIYTGVNFDTFLVKTDIITETNGCEYTFENEILAKAECPEEFDLGNNDLIGTYTIGDYYNDRKPTRPDYNLSFNSSY